MFKGARNVAYIGAISLTILLIILWPSAMTATGVFTLTNFKQWVGEQLSCVMLKKSLSQTMELYFVFTDYSL